MIFENRDSKRTWCGAAKRAARWLPSLAMALPAIDFAY